MDIKSLARQHCGDNVNEQNAFAAGFIKQAFSTEFFNKGVGETLGKGLSATFVGLGLAGLGKAVKNIELGSLHNQFLEALEHSVATNPVLKQADRERVVNYAETVFKFAPHVATDANLLSSILANAVHGDGIDPMTIRTLADLDGRYVDNYSASFSPKTYV